MGSDRVLVCRVGDRLCALPLSAVIETMRPLPCDPIAGSVEGVLGVSIIRGAATPVVDLAALFDERSAAPQRFVTVKTGPRVVALAVDEVVGVRALDDMTHGALPPLLGEARESAIAGIGTADAQLLVVLHAARLAPASLAAAEPIT